MNTSFVAVSTIFSVEFSINHLEYHQIVNHETFNVYIILKSQNNAINV